MASDTLFGDEGFKFLFFLKKVDLGRPSNRTIYIKDWRRKKISMHILDF